MAAPTDGDNDDTSPRIWEELPEDLWHSIFLKLQVKSLVLATFVCKHWYNLIKAPSFTRKHLQIQKTMSKTSGHFLLQFHHPFTRDLNYFLFDSESISRNRNFHHFFLRCTPGIIDIDGPVNGLYCLYSRTGRIVIWNPSTNEVGFLPLPEHCLLADPMDEEDYKVVLINCIICIDIAYGSRDRCLCMLYTTRTNRWRLLKVDHRKDDLARNESNLDSLNNTYLNGSYYWKEKGTCTALVFDMSKEVFRKISTPCDGHIALHNGCITLFSMSENQEEYTIQKTENQNDFDIWVMLEENNWIKKNSVRVLIQEYKVMPLGFWKTEKDLILVVDDFRGMNITHDDIQIVLYNTATQEFRSFGPKGFSCKYKAPVYYESFVSLSGDIAKYKGTVLLC